MKRGNFDAQYGVDCKKKFVSVPDRIIAIENDLSEQLRSLRFDEPVTHVYNPLEYAENTHVDFVRKYCQDTKKILFLGMNPGPYGMAQNGVPFGDTDHVINWLNINGTVNKPPLEHPHRPIQGLECARSEVSGRRFWGFFRSLCQTPENFFRNCYVHNYCPLVFMKSSGKNVTPPQLKAHEYLPLYSLCDTSLLDVIKLLEVSFIVGIGKFAENRAKKVLKSLQSHSIEVVTLLHPSPASPQANSGWDDIAHRQLTSCGLIDVISGV